MDTRGWRGSPGSCCAPGPAWSRRSKAAAPEMPRPGAARSGRLRQWSGQGRLTGSRVCQERKVGEQVVREMIQVRAYHRGREEQRQHYGEKLQGVGECLLLELGGGLQEGDDQPYNGGSDDRGSR